MKKADTTFFAIFKQQSLTNIISAVSLHAPFEQ
jgi:hypothetical protein